jgi:hypothetical protein
MLKILSFLSEESSGGCVYSKLVFLKYYLSISFIRETIPFLFLPNLKTKPKLWWAYNLFPYEISVRDLSLRSTWDLDQSD